MRDIRTYPLVSPRAFTPATVAPANMQTADSLEEILQLVLSFGETLVAILNF